MHDSAALAALYRTHAPVVFRRARQLLGRDADAYEVLQDVFLSLFERPEQYQGKSALSTFLYSATTHACLNQLRNQKNRDRLQRVHQDAAEAIRPTSRLTPEQTSMLHRAIQTMPDELCQAVIYYAVDGLSHQEIGELMNCSRRHVGDLLARAADWGNAEKMTPC
jgi:RNA polymerase sigma factor (sigma-70 family)